MTAIDPTARPDLERALLDPPSVFVTPESLADHPALATAEKIEILQRWAYDAADISVAVEEGMPGAEEPLLRRITLALQRLAGPLDLDQAGPSKQHGLAQGAVKPGG
jgi:hypothetical protein